MHAATNRAAHTAPLLHSSAVSKWSLNPSLENIRPQTNGWRHDDNVHFLCKVYRLFLYFHNFNFTFITQYFQLYMLQLSVASSEDGNVKLFYIGSEHGR